MMTTEHQPKKSERTCVGCGEHADPSALVRVVLGPEGELAIDAAGGAFGRGAHVHAKAECIARACRGGLSKAFKREVKMEASALERAIREAYERRAIGILLGARGAGYLALGADAAKDAMHAGATLVVLASDAGSVAKDFERAIAEGRAASFGTKTSLGEMFKTGETAVFAVRHAGVARALKEVLGIGQVTQ
jgi:predicted RNA-binding protein YlxR (DUF448 family)